MKMFWVFFLIVCFLSISLYVGVVVCHYGNQKYHHTQALLVSPTGSQEWRM